ncbi:MAG: DUF3293 domain-containing protein [Planctomycetota bacterium]|nr:MAG: DUF3293 domain-containing protein [Planctomycetota bacterium]
MSSEAETGPAAVDWVEVYQASRYAFVFQGVWRSFSLQGEEGPMADLPTSVTLVTAWNPESEERPLPWNEAANGRLLRQLVASGLQWGPAYGASLPGVEPSWREEGFAVFGLDRPQAAELGRNWGQRAVVWLDSEASELVFCDPEMAVSCGMSRFDG